MSTRRLPMVQVCFFMYGSRRVDPLAVDNGDGKSWLSSFSLLSRCVRGQGI
jgi:hypothetical protein